MIFNSKQLEELENIHDSTGAFEEEADDDGGFDDVGEAAMDWRRGIIEEAAESVKRAKTRPVEPSIQYPVGSLLFDRDARRFGRVQKSVPGYLKIVYLSGGDREYGTLDVQGYLREYGAQKRVSEMSEQLGMPDADVAIELERMGITPLEEPEPTPEEQAAAEAAAAVPIPVPVPRLPKVAKGKPKIEVEEEEESDDDDVADDADDVEASDDDDVADDDDIDVEALGDDAEEPLNGKKKPAGKAAAKAAPPAKGGKHPPPAKAAPPPAKGKAAPPAPVAKSAPKGAEKLVARGAQPPPKNEKKAPPPSAKMQKSAPASAKAAPAKADAGKKAGGKGVNPIDDPNGFIKANFQQMSNRELARMTGLSEHTIRRKLGEWGLKRAKGD